MAMAKNKKRLKTTDHLGGPESPEVVGRKDRLRLRITVNVVMNLQVSQQTMNIC
jgi:hypothetical protein